jgi:hypothetical protein
MGGHRWIFIFFNAYLFGTKAAKVIYVISYFRGIFFNWIKTYIDNFIAYKSIKRRVITAARIITQEMFTSYKKFKINIQQVFGDIK